MNRKDREITDRPMMEQILNEAEVIRLAMVDAGSPYLVAMNYAYAGGSLYMHSAQEGRKIDILKQNNQVAFQTDSGVELLLGENACSCATRYKSVFGTGRAFLVDDPVEKIKALNIIMAKYTGQAGMAFTYPEGVLAKTLIIKVEIEVLTGKKSGY